MNLDTQHCTRRMEPVEILHAWRDGWEARWLGLLALELLLILWPVSASAQQCVNNSTYLDLSDESASFPICHDGVLTCQEPELQLVDIALDPPDCDQTFQACAVTATVDTKFPGNHQNDPSQSGFSYSFGTLLLETASGGFVDACGVPGAVIRRDIGRFIHSVGVPCGLAKENPITFRLKLKATMCPCSPGVPFCPWQTSCEKETEIDLDFVLPSIECPPKNECCEECGECLAVGSGGVDATGGSAGICLADTGPGARLRYIAGGAGSENLPGSPAWAPVLGRGWSHDYAERLVRDPDDSRVWLITRFGSFREFRDGDADGDYEFVSPSDETRVLRRTAGGWELEALDGTVQSFDSSGRWLSVLDRNGIGKTASYGAGGLTQVDMADGRQERFTYHPDGKLAEIVEVGVDGLTTRIWSYSWVGGDLAEILRPDGTRLRYRYEDPRHPGYMTQSILVATDGSERIETAWRYDHAGRAISIWKGDVTPGPNGPVPGPGAIDLRSMSFTEKDSVGLVTKSLVTDPLGQVSTYEFERDSVSAKPRLSKITGNCPTCGLGPDSQLFYEDPANPMRPTRIIDARGTVTLMGYDSRGRRTSLTEAFGTSLERTTTWEYDENHPALVTAIERPSIAPGSLRRTTMVLDGGGNATQKMMTGVEDGSAFSYTTVTTYAPSGLPQTVDPPGYGTADVTSFSYDPARGNLVPLSRTDPLVGTTSFVYDPFNRRTATTDPNGLTTETEYDALNRVTRFIRKGALVAEDLTSESQYNAFGDLERTILPEGNVIEYGYDDEGRLTAIAHGAAPGALSERRVFELDAAGNRTNEKRQRWTGSAWETTSETDFVYTRRCRADRVIRAPGTAAEAITEYGYDCNGSLESVWDANRSAVSDPPSRRYVYDALDRLTTVIEPWAGGGGGDAVTSFGYDVADNLTSVTDAEGNVTTRLFSDRDLLTSELAAETGESRFAYNEHGEIISETDGRGTPILRTVDALGRLVFVDSPEDALDTTYVYDDPAVAFSKGRITAALRGGEAVEFQYDRFGRTISDGTLGYAYDKNGNRIRIDYPGGVRAIYTHDFAGRDQTLVVEDGTATIDLVSSASYLPSGPLETLALGNGVNETRGFDRRYLPTAITAAGLLDWSYTTDGVGNVLQITSALHPGDSRAYAYQDIHYFLTRGDGPWGDLSWSYDRTGNRLTETRDGTTANYSYVASATGGNSARLARSTSGSGEVTRYFYDGAGNQTHRSVAAAKQRYGYDALGRMSQILTDGQPGVGTRSNLTYDGRSFLALATRTPFPGRPATSSTEPTYTSDGQLMHRKRAQTLDVDDPRDGVSAVADAYVFYLDTRPVGILEKETVTDVTGGSSSSTRLLYLTTDHLRTPVLATDGAGAQVWRGGFEPFGADYSGAADAGVFLRRAGQWAAPEWNGDEAGGSALYYNVHRWLRTANGRYTRSDPIGVLRPDDRGAFTANLRYAYAEGNPTFFTDPLGLKVVIENPKIQKAYDNLKKCFPLFKTVAEHFEGDKWTRWGPDRTWPVKDPDWQPASCGLGGRNSEPRTVWVPPDRDCEGTARCLLHEFYEKYLIDVKGYKKTQMQQGPADDAAREAEELIPFDECCC